MLDSCQVTSMLLRWTTNAPGDDGGENKVASDVGDADVAAAKEKAVLVAAGLKTLRIVCTKADNNKGELSLNSYVSTIAAQGLPCVACRCLL